MRNLLIAGLLTFATVACDNPVEPEDHPEAGGVVIFAAGTSTVLAMSVGSEVEFDLPITMNAGEAVEIEVMFLDASAPADLTRAFHPHEDDGESLRITVEDESVVEYHAHGDHGDLEAGAAGETTLTVELWHGSHADFVSGPLTITVN